MSAFTLPGGWTIATLGAICSPPQYGWTTSASSTGQVKLLRTTDITSGAVDWDAVPFCDEAPDDLKKYQLRGSDIVISRAGSVGVSHLLREVPRSAVFASYLIRFCPIAPTDARFVGYFLQTPSYWAAITDRSAGIALQNVNAKKLESIEIPLAPENEQRRIVAKLEELLSDLHVGTASLERARANLRRYRAAVLKAAVEGRLTQEWRAAHSDVEPASKLLERILAVRRKKWEEAQLGKYAHKGQSPPKGWKDKYPAPVRPEVEGLPELPRGWCWASWSQIGESQNGRPFPSVDYCEVGVRLLRPGNFYATGAIGWTVKNTRCLPEKYANENPDLIVGGGELVINLTAQSLKDEFLGRVCMTPSEERCLLNQRLARLRPILVLPRFMLWLFKSYHFRKFVAGLNTGSLIQHMFTSQIEQFVLPLPPLAEQEAIVRALEEQLSIVDSLEAQITARNNSSEALRQAILKRAFEGKLVPQDPKDEPAGKLLARIREQREAGPAAEKKGARVRAA